MKSILILVLSIFLLSSCDGVKFFGQQNADIDVPHMEATVLEVNTQVVIEGYGADDGERIFYQSIE